LTAKTPVESSIHVAGRHISRSNATITRVSGVETEQTYSRKQVCRLLSMSVRRLESWERQELIPRLENFAFSDLVALRTLTRLYENRVPASRIRQAVVALRGQLRDVSDPLKELKIYADGRKITVHLGASRMEPISGQLLLDFDQEELNKLRSFPGSATPQSRKAAAARRHEAVLWFEKALEIEQRGGPAEEAIQAYQKAIELDPTSAGAHVNLGTIYFHLRRWEEAERQYRRALEADPQYALAHFNLGNLFDEINDRAQALLHYMMAIRLNPAYGDAHYNIALLYQGSGQVMRAVRHWKEYLKLDSTSPWAEIARQELDKLRRATLVSGSSNRAEGPGAGSAS
jgi:tetratricopeptide (TPR) repeat protein